MDQNFKQKIILIIVTMILLVVALNIKTVLSILLSLFTLLLPIFIGMIFAFILSVPMKAIENKIASIRKKEIDKKTSIIAFFLTILLLISVIAIVLIIVIPELSISISELSRNIKQELPNILNFLRDYNFDVNALEDLIKNLDFEKIFNSLTSSTGVILNNLAKFSSSLISVLSTGSLGLIIGVYILIDKRNLALKANKIIQAYFPKYAPTINHISKLFQNTFSSFLTGQCLEAIILGTLIFIVFSILNLPYSGLIGILTGFCAFIPYIGAFLSLLIGSFLILISTPDKILICIVAYLLTQFVENQFIYPRVVGSSVGLSPLLTLIAVMIGGSLFGVIGMIFFIPLTASCYALIKEDVNKRLKTTS